MKASYRQPNERNGGGLSNARWVFHYAPWARLPAIMESGELRCSNAGAADELPLLWLSANQYWEPTATKLLKLHSGELRRLSFREMEVRFGCVRFALPADDPRLLDWQDACRYAGTPRATRRSLEQVGRSMGGNPKHWFAVTASLSVNSLPFQVLLNGAWVVADPREMTRELPLSRSLEVEHDDRNLT